MKEQKHARVKPKVVKTEMPVKLIQCRLPRNYTWNGNGYDIR